MSTPPQTIERRRLRNAFLAACAMTLVLHLVQPWGRYALYPIALLSTWAHEMGHGLCAALLGGQFLDLELRANLGGTAHHTVTGLARPLVAMAGLLGPAIAGAVMIVLGARSERSARWVLQALGVAVLISALVWVRPVTSFGFPATLVLSALLLGASYTRRVELELFLVQLIGIQLCLEVLSDFDYMFTNKFERDGQVLSSDTATMAEHWLLPYWVWGGLVAGLSLLILAAAFWLAWIRTPKSAPGGK